MRGASTTWVACAAACLGSLGVTVAATAADAGGDPVSTLVDTSGLCLGITGSGGAVGAVLQGQACNGSAFQNWKFVKDATGDFQLVNAGSGMCIDVTGGSTANGTALQQWGCSGGTYQKWTLSDQGAGRFAITSKYNRLVLQTSGAGVVQWSWAGSGNQLWASPSANVVVASPGPANHSVVTFKSVRNGSCLGVDDSSTASGARIKAQACGNTAFQQWKALKSAGGDYQFVNVGSGLCMDLPGASIAPGTPIQQWGCSGGTWQMWRVHSAGRDHHYVTSRFSGQALDEGPQGNNGRIIQWAYNGTPNQQWMIIGDGAVEAIRSVPPADAATVPSMTFRPQAGIGRSLRLEGAR